MNSGQTRTYQRAASVVFLKTNEAFGGLSNMAGGFPLRVNGVRILTSEALYQACRFPHLPDVQRLIIEQRSPMTAKMKSKPHRTNSRRNWFQVRVKIMRWCLHVKLAQNWRKFSELLLETGDRPIVEQSRKDDFWGAKPVDDDTLIGMNVLGRLLMELREAVKTDSRETLCFVQPLAIPDFLLGGEPIGVVDTRVAEIAREQTQADVQKPRGDVDGPPVVQQSLFDEPVASEVPLQTNPGVKDSGVRIAHMKPYSEYKESGLPWVREVPGHWGLVPNRGLVRRRKVLVGNRHSDFRLLSLTKQGIIVRDISTGKGKFSSDMGTSQVVRNGDFVFCLFDVPETPRTVGLSRHDGMITGAYTVFESLCRGSPEYFELFYRAMDDRKLLSPLYSGLRNTIPADRFLGTKTPQPPPDEQAAIVRFLDWANGRLERAIRAKRKVIALLNEQKQAIIHLAVTRGLDPSVPLKPSGIPWLGDIPQYWDLIPARHLFRSVTRRDIQGDELKMSVTQKHGLVQTAEMQESSTQASSFDRFQLCHPNDLVLNKYKAHLGVFWAAIQRGLITPNYTVFRPARRLSTKFFEHLFHTQAYRDAFSMVVYGVIDGMCPLYTQDFYRIPCVCPAYEEQVRIVDALVNMTMAEDSTISRLEREIDLLREYRTRLVADVVTGKLDVREAATRVPDEAPLETAEEDADMGDETGAAGEEAIA